MTTLRTTCLALLAGLSLNLSPAYADERPDHFHGHPSENLSQAVANLTKYNAELATLVARDKLSLEELTTVHELTYTLEKALERVKLDLEQISADLEEVHQASERADGKTVQDSGKAYLKAVRTLVP